MSKWVTWDSLASFELWHNNLKEILGYPIPSIDAATGEVGPPFTTDYVNPVVVTDSDVRAFVEAEYAVGLTECDAPPILNTVEDAPHGWIGQVDNNE
jgi:hypothetical protein